MENWHQLLMLSFQCRFVCLLPRRGESVPVGGAMAFKGSSGRANGLARSEGRSRPVGRRSLPGRGDALARRVAGSGPARLKGATKVVAA